MTPRRVCGEHSPQTRVVFPPTNPLTNRTRREPPAQRPGRVPGWHGNQGDALTI